MKTLIISYSLTGNNAKLAQGLSNELAADLLEINELRKRSILSIICDVIFNRTPRIQQTSSALSKYESLIFTAPVWMGMAASPLRSLLKSVQKTKHNYAFVSISAGADGKNQKLETDLEKRTGISPLAVINPLITDLFPDKKLSRKELDLYRLADNIAKQLVGQVSAERKTILPK